MTTRVNPRVLFFVKRKEDYNAITDSHIGLSTGLYNSCSFVVNMLNEAGIDAKIEVVIDNNDIDREVTKHQPTHVIIEALWVVPTKFSVLTKLHPGVQWIIRLHSEVPFIASEGIAMDWIAEYSSYPQISLGVNSEHMLREMRNYLRIRNGWDDETTQRRVISLPNYYPLTKRICKRIDYKKPTVDIGCFGAVRPLKNHLMQALAAVEFADEIGKKLVFHTNSGRVEGMGQPMLKNLRELFQQLSRTGHQMIEHPWCPHEDFLMLCARMDIGMQVSFSETFNIVGADLTRVGVPVVTSTELPWASEMSAASPTDSVEIVEAMRDAYKWPRINNWLNYWGLRRHTKSVRTEWLRHLKGRNR